MTAPAIQFEGRADIDGAPLFAALRLELVLEGWTCLLGPSGVGKSTVLRLIAGLQTGADFFGNITASDGDPLPDRIAYMAQDDLLLPWLDLRGNVALGAKLRGQPIDTQRLNQMIERVGLTEHATKRPVQLSGGQRQRAALARTLMEARPVVLLDEPFSALDARTRADMQDLAAELLTEATVLLVTHDPAEAARLGHKICLLEASGLTEIPPPSTAPIRPVDDPETLAFQARLLTLLRERG